MGCVSWYQDFDDLDHSADLGIFTNCRIGATVQILLISRRQILIKSFEWCDVNKPLDFDAAMDHHLDTGNFNGNFNHRRIGAFVRILRAQLPWWRFAPSEYFSFYISLPVLTAIFQVNLG